MPREVTAPVLWLAPPVLFSVGIGYSQPTYSEGFGNRPEESPFVDLRVGYPRSKDVTFGLRARSSHLRVELLDSSDEFVHTYDGYALALTGTGEVEAGAFVALLGLGLHTARMTYRGDTFMTGPAFAAQAMIGFHFYKSERYRFTGFVELQGTGSPALPAGNTYHHGAYGFGFVVRF